jgi:hypothetical protein
MMFLVTVFEDYSFNGRLRLVGFDNPSNNTAQNPLPILDTVLAIIAMVIGITFGVLHTALEPSEAVKLPLKQKIANALVSAQLVRSLIAAPLIFCGIYAATKTQPDRVVAMLFAFQNGFFCNAILKSKLNPQEPVKPDEPHH